MMRKSSSKKKVDYPVRGVSRLSYSPKPILSPKTTSHNRFSLHGRNKSPNKGNLNDISPIARSSSGALLRNNLSWKDNPGYEMKRTTDPFRSKGTKKPTYQTRSLRESANHTLKNSREPSERASLRASREGTVRGSRENSLNQIRDHEKRQIGIAGIGANSLSGANGFSHDYTPGGKSVYSPRYKRNGMYTTKSRSTRSNKSTSEMKNSKSESHLGDPAQRKKIKSSHSRSHRGEIHYNNYVSPKSKMKISVKAKDIHHSDSKPTLKTPTERRNLSRPDSSKKRVVKSPSRATPKVVSPIDIGIPNIVEKVGVSTQTGFIPFKAKVNQDNFFMVQNFNNILNQWLFVCCDGHGVNGHFASEHIRQRLAYNVEVEEKLYLRDNKARPSEENAADTANDFKSIALRNGFIRTNEELINRSFDCNFSGSTVVSTMILGNKLWCANAGDSRAVLGRFNGEAWSAIPLSRDHKPDDEGEYARIMSCNGRVDPFREPNGDPIGPARVWLKHENAPGLAMARSMGDCVAASVGVTCDPEIMHFDITPEDKFLILASDGVWEFLSNEDVVSMIVPYWQAGDPDGACERISQESTRKWREEDEVIDDITMVIVYLDENVLAKYFAHAGIGE